MENVNLVNSIVEHLSGSEEVQDFYAEYLISCKGQQDLEPLDLHGVLLMVVDTTMQELTDSIKLTHSLIQSGALGEAGEEMAGSQLMQEMGMLVIIEVLIHTGWSDAIHELKARLAALDKAAEER